MGNRPKIGLALSGGAALGFAHLGVLEVFEENKIPIDVITGTSMGAMVGGVYATGRSIEDMKKFASKISLLNFFDINFDVKGIFSGRSIENLIKKFSLVDNIEQCKIPFACVAVDIVSEKEHIFNSGNIATAIRSSIGIPGIFVPEKVDNMLLIDGGVANVLPGDVAVDMGCDIVIGVDVQSAYHFTDCPKNFFESVFSAFFLSSKFLQKHRKNFCNLILTIEQPDVKMTGFNKKEAFLSIEYGRQCAIKMMPKIKKLLEKKGVKLLQTKNNKKNI